MKRISLSSLKTEHVILGLIMLCGAYLAVDKNFLQDDAYISFRYAKHFAQGHGLVWYPGSDEYGYTNFLFTLLIGVLMKVGLAPETASYLLSVPSFFGILLFTYLIGKRVVTSIVPVLLTCMAVATNHTMNAYATGGLETSMQICLVLAVYYFVLRWYQERERKPLTWIALFSSLALLTRLDSALLLLPGYAYIAVHLAMEWQQKKIPFSTILWTILQVTVWPVLAVIGLLVFCYEYYNGHAMPTSFYAKLDDRWYVLHGFQYVFAFIRAQAYVPLLLMGAWFLMVSEKDFTWYKWRYRLLLVSYIFIWLLYILHVGGDFMEFRFLLAILPFFYLLIFDLIIDNGRRENGLVVVLLALVTLGGNYIQPHYFATKLMDKNLIESTGLLNRWIEGYPYNWRQAGNALREKFYTGNPGDVKIAVTGAGAIPYYSNLKVVDQHGLNTREVIEFGGESYQPRPGHRVKAKVSYLKKAGVNLIIDHPLFLKKKGDEFHCLRASIFITHKSLMDIQIVFVPLDEPYYLLAHYLVKHDLIEEMIQKREIIRYHDVIKQTKCGKKFEIPALGEKKSS